MICGKELFQMKFWFKFLIITSLFISGTMTSSSPFLGNRKIGRSTCIQLRQVSSRNISQTFNIVIQPKRVYGIQSGEYLIFNIEYQYGGDSKFELRNEIFEKFEYPISIWWIFDIKM